MPESVPNPTEWVRIMALFGSIRQDSGDIRIFGGNHMLAKQHRLRAERDITRVIKTGRYASSPAMTVRAARGTKVTRAAVVAGLKVEKSAVKRNLVKRRIREAMREILPEVAEGYDLVVVARSGAVGKSYQDLGNELYGSLGRLGLIHRPAKQG